MTIQQALNNIKNAIHGRDIRSSIHDGIKLCYNERLPGGLNPVMDLNSFPSGIAMITTNIENAPFTSNFLIIAGGDSTGSFQIAYDISNDNPPQFRKKQNGSWSNWAEFSPRLSYPYILG